MPKNYVVQEHVSSLLQNFHFVNGSRPINFLKLLVLKVKEILQMVFTAFS